MEQWGTIFHYLTLQVSNEKKCRFVRVKNQGLVSYDAQGVLNGIYGLKFQTYQT